MAEKFKQFATDAFTGGTEDQVIKKKSGSDFDFGWGNGGGGGGGVDIKTAELQVDSEWVQLSEFTVTSGNVCRDPDYTLQNINAAFAIFYGSNEYCIAVKANGDSVQFLDGESPIVHTILRDTKRNETYGITYNEYIICEPLKIDVSYDTTSEDFANNAPRGAGLIIKDDDILYDQTETHLNHLIITCPNCTMTEMIPDSDPSNKGYALNMHEAFGFGSFFQKNPTLDDPIRLEVDIRVPGLFEVPITVDFEEV